MATTAAIAGNVFVGRVPEMLELRSSLKAALASHGRAIMLIGEPGIGKTRTADELSHLAEQSGARVCWGRCWEGHGAPAYWPWIQIIRSILSPLSKEQASWVMGPGAADIAKIAPDVGAKADVRPARGSVETDQGRFRLFDSVVTLLKNATATTPMMLVLDDLHWADKPSLLLLHFLSRELRALPILVVGTYRDVEIGADHPNVETLGRLARESERVRLSGLTEEDIARFIERVYGVEPSPALVAAVYQDTQGNPFFIDEVVRLLAAEQRLETPIDKASWSPVVPQGVKEVIHRRLNQLSKRCNVVLRVAAVMGRQFDLEIIASIANEPAAARTIQEAIAAKVVEELADHPGRFEFTHVLIRETLYGELSTAEKRRLHTELGRVLKDLWAEDPDFYLFQLAYHFFEGGSDLEKAMDYAIKAGERATLRLAYEEAASQYIRALRALEKKGQNGSRRCDLLLMLGDAQSRAAEVREARLTFEQAAKEARRIDDPDRLARAALGFGGRFIRLESGMFDKALVDLLTEALRALGNRRGPLVPTVLARLSRALFYAEDQEERVQLAEKALRMATRLNDPAAKMAALHAKFWTLRGPDKSKQRMTTAQQIVDLAEQSSDEEMALQGHLWNLMEHAELGEMQAVRDEIEIFVKFAEDLRQPLYLWFGGIVRANLLLMQGMFELGESVAREALATGQRAEIGLAEPAFQQQMLWVWREQKRLGEATFIGRKLPPDYQDSLAAQMGRRALRSLVLEGQGQIEMARLEFKQVTVDDLAKVPWDLGWLGLMSSVADACASVGEGAQAEGLFDLLEPYSGRCVRFGPAVDYSLGRLSAFLGRWEDSKSRLQKALKLHSSVGSRPWVARTQYEYAVCLINSGGDTSKAGTLLARAKESATALGMARLAEQVEEFEKSLQRETGVTQDLSVRPVEVAPDQPPKGDNVFRKEGDYWTIAYGSRITRLRDSKGLHYLEILLRHPNRELHVADLAGIAGATTVSGGPLKNNAAIRAEGLSVISSSDAGELLDQTARRQYQKKLSDLNQEIEEAEDSLDLGRTERLREEIDFLTDQLTAAYGMSGRARKAGDTVDRIRKAVTNRIRSSLTKISDQAPELGSHLSNAIKTGTFCSYNPERPIKWN